MQRLWELDQQIFRAIHHGWHQSWLDPIFWVISTSGLGWVQMVALLLGWYVFRVRTLAANEGGSGLAWALRGFKGFRLTEWRAWVWPLILCYAASGILNSAILKKVFDRDRPSRLWDSLPQEGFHHNAFPSGHTASAFAIAFYLFLRWYGTERQKWGWGVMAWACLVGLSRIYRGVHWPTDVMGGACIGMLTASVVYLWLDGREGNDPESEPAREV
ncbi:MAG: phosphatase PAP2 family protein [Fimbriimonadaceae bacterium]|nr:phosphatase PAP2 family protein [Fimbriimonadaceae bacterium]